MTRVIALVTLLISVAPLTTAEPPSEQPGRFSAIRRGMSPDEVTRLLGPPQQIARQILFRRYLEQWRYEDVSGWLEFNMPRGEGPHLINIYDNLPSRRP